MARWVLARNISNDMSLFGNWFGMYSVRTRGTGGRSVVGLWSVAGQIRYVGICFMTLTLAGRGKIGDLSFWGKLLVFGPSSAMLARVVLMVIFCSERLSEVLDPLGCSALGAGFLFASKLLTEATCDGGDGLGGFICQNSAKAIKKGVTGLERGISLFSRHGIVLRTVDRSLLDNSVKGRVMGCCGHCFVVGPFFQGLRDAN